MKEKIPDFIIAGLGFGDEGKGSITDYLVAKYGIPTVIRYNGGSQAAHNVVTPEGISHTFSQFSSGTFIKNTNTFLSSQMLMDPYSLLQEDFALKKKGITDALNRLLLDKNCVIITPFHKMLGRIHEIGRGNRRFSSTGKGVGQAVFDLADNGEFAIRVKDFYSKNVLWDKVEFIYFDKIAQAKKILSLHNSNEAEETLAFYKNEYTPTKLFNFYSGFAKSYSNCIDKKGNYLANLINTETSFLLEGAQGALLDPEFGFTPYITKTNTRFEYGKKLLSKSKTIRNPICIGILRAYSHRHGNGPLPTESKFLSKKIQEEHNVNNPWQGAFRIGWLDMILCRYSISMNPFVDSIALTCLDQLTGLSTIKVCLSYRYRGIIPESLTGHFQFTRIKDFVKITGINLISNFTVEQRKELTEIMLKCEPLDYLEFSGWKEDISQIQSVKSLPRNVKNYLDYLESEEGLNVPISILSFGKTRIQKMIYREINSAK